jgi:hypothetical protein
VLQACRRRISAGKLSKALSLRPSDLLTPMTKLLQTVPPLSVLSHSVSMINAKHVLEGDGQQAEHTAMVVLHWTLLPAHTSAVAGSRDTKTGTMQATGLCLNECRLQPRCKHMIGMNFMPALNAGRKCRFCLACCCSVHCIATWCVCSLTHAVAPTTELHAPKTVPTTTKYTH